MGIRKEKRKLVIGIAAVMLLLSACGKASSNEFTPNASSIYVKRDKTVKSALVEQYENEYYSEEELSQFLKDAVLSYNNSVQGQENSPVVLESCSLADGTASAVFSYQSAEDFLKFAEAEQDTDNLLSEFYVMQVSDGFSAGLILDGTFVKAKDQKTVDAEKITRQSDLYMVAATGEALIQTEGKVQYVSEGCEVKDDFTVQTPKEGRSYIIFK